MSKLKRGDVVVLVHIVPHWTYEISVVDFTRYFADCDRYYLKQLEMWVDASEVELEQVFHSPLYQALK